MTTIDVEAISRRMERRTDLLVGWVAGLLTAMSFGLSVMSAIVGAYVMAGFGAAMALACVGMYAMRMREVERS